MASKVAARTNKRLYDVAPEEYEEAKLLVSKAYEVNPRSDEFKSKVSLGMRRYRAENAFTEEHLRRIRESTSRHKEENLKLGLTIYGTPIRKSGECGAAQQFASRSKGVYCILSSGERFYFKSIREASI